MEGEGDLNHRVLENFSHLFVPGPDISKKKNPKNNKTPKTNNQPLSKLKEGSEKVNPGTTLPSALLEDISPWKTVSLVGSIILGWVGVPLGCSATGRDED